MWGSVHTSSSSTHKDLPLLQSNIIIRHVLIEQHQQLRGIQPLEDWMRPRNHSIGFEDNWNQHARPLAVTFQQHHWLGRTLSYRPLFLGPELLDFFGKLVDLLGGSSLLRASLLSSVCHLKQPSKIIYIVCRLYILRQMVYNFYNIYLSTCLLSIYYLLLYLLNYLLHMFPALPNYIKIIVYTHIYGHISILHEWHLSISQKGYSSRMRGRTNDGWCFEAWSVRTSQNSALAWPLDPCGEGSLDPSGAMMDPRACRRCSLRQSRS